MIIDNARERSGDEHGKAAGVFMFKCRFTYSSHCETESPR
jgi:hypothetical protein